MKIFVSRVQALKVSDPPTERTGMGPRISKVEVEKLWPRRWSRERASSSTWTSDDAVFAKGYWAFPTVLSVQPNDAAIMQQEAFGPVIAAMKVDGFDQAVAYATDSDSGLSADLFTPQNRLVMRAVSELHFGEVYVSRPSGESPHGFHTGYRRSGPGGEGGQHGVEGYVRKKTMYNNYG